MSEEEIEEVEEGEEQPKVNFYKLDKSKPYKSVYAGTSSYSGAMVLIVFSIVLLVAGAVFVIVNFIKNSRIFDDITAIIAPIFFAAIGSLFLGLGIRSRKKEKGLKGAEGELFKDCTLTDGRIVFYRCTRRETGSSEHSHTYYDVEMEYVFYGKDLNVRRGGCKITFGAEPQFYKGQYVMVAFNDTGSVIMSEYTLEKDDERRFLQAESARSDDDFDDIDGELLDVDLNRPIKDYQYSYGWLWGAFAVCIFLLGYTIPISICVVPQFIGFRPVAVILIAVIAIYIMPAILIGVIIWLLKNYFKRSKQFKKIMSSNPYFTFGKMFASEKTYRGGMRKKVLYCYIDKWGEKHTEVVTSPVAHRIIDDENIDVVVAYTAAGDSTVISHCKFTDED